jgi:hypothetical protein
VRSETNASRFLAIELSDTLRETTEATRTGGLGTIGREQMMNFGFNSLLGLLILAGDIWAIINILQSSVSNEKKLLWIIVVVLLPLLGLILWYFLGPRNRRA